MIIEDPSKGVIVPDLTEISIEDSSLLHHIIVQGNHRRMMAATCANQFSSRSHSILIVQIESRCPDNPSEIVYSKL